MIYLVFTGQNLEVLHVRVTWIMQQARNIPRSDGQNVLDL